jgi:hypothetical protein
VGLSTILRPRARRIGAAMRNRFHKMHPFELIAFLAVLGLAGIMASAILANFTEDKWRDALWLEVAKAGV